jgi:hypothetical protein
MCVRLQYRRQTCRLFLADRLLASFLSLVYGSSTFRRNVDELVTDYTALTVLLLEPRIELGLGLQVDPRAGLTPVLKNIIQLCLCSRPAISAEPRWIVKKI